jgi:hypothetical protein
MAIISLCFNAVKVEAYPSGYMFLKEQYFNKDKR